ncbi:hypothetical protein HK405_011518, partial [Cladochytrium tenue]
PNSGEDWDGEKRVWVGSEWGGTPSDYADLGVEWVKAGAVAVGGCCRTTPEHIRLLRERLAGPSAK